MKKLLVVCTLCLTVIAASTLSIALLMYQSASYDAVSVYATTAYVLELDHETDTVIFEDADGNMWECSGCSEWEEGELASILMHDNGTPDILSDDVILSAVYAGFTL